MLTVMLCYVEKLGTHSQSRKQLSCRLVFKKFERKKEKEERM